MTWSELHTLARETAAKAMNSEPVKPEALQTALRILEIGMMAPKDIKERLNG